MDNMQKTTISVFWKIKISEGRKDIKRLQVFIQRIDYASVCKQFYETKNKLATRGIQIHSLLCSGRKCLIFNPVDKKDVSLCSLPQTRKFYDNFKPAFSWVRYIF